VAILSSSRRILRERWWVCAAAFVALWPTTAHADEDDRGAAFRRLDALSSVQRAYSPYQNVEKGKKYAAVLFITGDGDTRVAPLHARKMAAMLQANTCSERPILLLYDTKSGHSGGRPINKIIEEDTDILSFLFWQIKVPQAGK
jgi:hypothetical protein